MLPLVGATHACAQSGGYTAQELDDLLGPIALYPDPLLSQVLSAATFPDQLNDAAALVQAQGPSAIGAQSWDDSVKAVAGYPEVLNMLTSDPDWTADLGWAVTNQQQDVLASVQRLRWQAQAEGNLASTPQQQVVVQDQMIEILPAQPNVIYVPQYDPTIIYVDRGPYFGEVGVAGFITFGLGYAFGSWSNPFDWHHSHWNYPPPAHRYPYGRRPPSPPGPRPPGPRPPGLGSRPPAVPGRAHPFQGTRPPAVPGTRPPVPGTRPPAVPRTRPPVPGTRPPAVPGRAHPAPARGPPSHLRHARPRP